MTDLHPIIFLGAGPGDPELITVKGMKALSRADVVLYAGSLVSPAVLTWAPPAADMVDTAPLALEDIVARLIQAHRDGQRVVRVHSGDTSLLQRPGGTDGNPGAGIHPLAGDPRGHCRGRQPPRPCPRS